MSKTKTKKEKRNSSLLENQGEWKKGRVDRNKIRDKLTRLLADDTSLEALADLARGEVEAFAPAVLVKVRDERVELVDKLGSAQDPVSHALAVLLVKELVVGLDSPVYLILGHGASLAGEAVKGVLAEPGVFDREVRRGGDTTADGDPLHGRILEVDHEVTDDSRTHFWGCVCLG